MSASSSTRLGAESHPMVFDVTLQPDHPQKRLCPLGNLVTFTTQDPCVDPCFGLVDNESLMLCSYRSGAAMDLHEQSPAQQLTISQKNVVDYSCTE
ncbi:hypothetical protein DUI87_16412 [Hirundo rustica rustica]|uniref:Uncharacterized protein n=1 Tax=Hirundo rustica rustica TaxID=333673 RepID=A0A3M0K7C6_HIRRU|nr:hypothetical protein DUI87_16412 [Hirundo rustica rustica]